MSMISKVMTSVLWVLSSPNVTFSSILPRASILFPPEANEWVLGLVQVLLCEPHLQEALPSEDICGATIVDKDPADVVSHKVYRISSNVCTNDEGIIVRVMLKPQVGFGAGYWDVRPSGAEMFAFADMRDCAKVFFFLTLFLMYWFV